MMDNNKTILDLLEKWAKERGDKIACIGLDEYANETERISHGNLFRVASSFSYFLHKNDLKQKENAVLLVDSDLNLLKMFIGCLLCGVCPIPMKAELNNATFLKKLSSILVDSGTSTIITTKHVGDFIGNSQESMGQQLKFVHVDDFHPNDDSYHCAGISQKDTASLLYTSGSTGLPKGIKLLHSSLYHHVEIISDSMGLSGDSIVVNWLPLHHSAGLNLLSMEGILIGGTSVVMLPETFARSPLSWIKTISKYGGTYSGGPNSAYDLCLECANEKDLEGVDLSSWKTAYNASQIIKDSTIKSFFNTFKKYGFSETTMRNFYGMTECVSAVTGSVTIELPPPTSPRSTGNNSYNFSSQSVPSCGKPVLGCTVKTVDIITKKQCAPYEVGEVYINSPAVAGGYMNEELNDVFRGKIEGDDKIYFCGGDLGFFDENNNLFVCGRLQDFIIINGTNYHYNDIEACLEDVDEKLSQNFVGFSLLVDGDEHLGIAIEALQNITKDEGDRIANIIRNKILNSVGILTKVVLILEANVIPRTSIGKLQRHECRRLYCDGQLKILHKCDFSRAKKDVDVCISSEDDNLTKIMKTISSVVQNIGEINENSKINSLGLDSLTATRIISRIRLSFGVELSIADVLFANTIGDIVNKISSATHSSDDSFAAFLDSCGKSKLGYKNENPISRLQKEILLEEERNDGKTLNENVCFCLKIKGNFRLDLFKKSMELVADQQKQLGMVFHKKNDDYLQKYCEHNRIVEVDLSDDDEINSKIKNVITKFFDLQNSALEITIFRKASDEFLILFSIHHAIFDHWSFGVLLNSIFNCYSALEKDINHVLPGLDFDYLDFVEAESKWFNTQNRNNQLGYWIDQLQDLPVLKLPYDFPRNDVQSHRGSMVYFSIDKDIYSQIKKFAERNSVTIYMTLLSIFKILLCKYSEQTDITVGSAVANRSSNKIESVIGYFSNMLAIRSKIDLEKSFVSLLGDIKKTVLDAQNNSNIPPEEVVRNLKNFPGVLPYRVAFLVQNTPKFDFTSDEFAIDFVDVHNGSCNFDLEVNVTESNEQLDITIEYCRDVFHEKTVTTFWNEYMNILQKALGNESTLVRELAEVKC